MDNINPIAMTSHGPPNKKPKCVGDKSVVEIQSILECPVCLLTPRNPEKVHICSNHHIVCDNCKSKIDKCPVCRSENFQGKNPLLEKILSALPKICSFAENGCEVEFEPRNGDGMENHLKICQHRQIDCAYNNCNVKVSFSNLKKHMEDIHEMDCIDGYDNYKMAVKVEEFTREKRVSHWYPSYMKFDGQVFYIQAFQKNDHFYLQCIFHGTEAESKKYFCDISAENEASPRFKAKVNFSVDVISVDIPKAARYNMKSSIFSITNHMAQQLWNKNEEDISFKITIKRE